MQATEFQVSRLFFMNQDSPYVNLPVAYNFLAGSGILFNHKSPLVPKRFVTQKIVALACRNASESDGRPSTISRCYE